MDAPCLAISAFPCRVELELFLLHSVHAASIELEAIYARKRT